MLATIVRYVCVAAILAGIALRFANLDAKLFSFDEATTSIRVAGYTLAEYSHDGFSGRVEPNVAFSRYQHVDGQHSTADAIRSLADEDPQHPPLYYLLERCWSQLFGNTVAVRRQISAIAGSFALIAAVWLGFELTGMTAAGLTFAALLAVSPFFTIYSQEAREYSVWQLCTLVASALLVRAVRTETVFAWAAYALALTLGLYSDLLFLYVLAAHAVYCALVALVERNGRLGSAFVISASVALIGFAPWLHAVVRGRALLTNNDYLSTPVPASIFALKWLFNTGAVFFDLEYDVLAAGIVLLPIFGLLCWAIFDLFRNREPRVWAFVATLGIVTAAALLVPDLAQHESRSTAARYLVPAWLALELAVALLLTRLLAGRTGAARSVAVLAFAGLFFCGMISAIHDSAARTSWAEGKSIAGLAPMAETIARAQDPLVVYVDDPQRFDFVLLALSNQLGPNVRMQHRNIATTLDAGRSSGAVFVLDPTNRVRSAFERSGATLRLVYDDAESDAAPDAIRTLRVQAARVRRAHGVEIEGLSLWRLEGSSRDR